MAVIIKFITVLILWVLANCVLPKPNEGKETCSQQIIASCEQEFEERLSHRTTSYYRAAVVEYKPLPIGNQSAEEAILKNVRTYVELINNAGAQNADIIVFPEYGITTVEIPTQRVEARKFFVEIPPLGTTPCDSHNSEHDQVLYELSCVSKLNKIYSIVNVGEYEHCITETDPDCPNDGAYHYNTNVVFSKNGTIIARYRKFHLYFEPQFDYPSLEYTTFSTDFDVKFGVFTCFDIIFAHPAVELAATKGIRNFVFPTAWVDELPFLTAIQAQSLWAQSNNVNLLASGYHQPQRGSMGSGIYSGYQSLNYVFDPLSGTRLLLADVPIAPETNAENHVCTPFSQSLELDLSANEPKLESNHFWLREDLSICSVKSIDPKLGKESLCHEDLFCCDIEYDLISNDYFGDLKLLVFDGRRTVAAKRDWFEWQVCAVIHCLNDTLTSCTENIKPLNSSSHPKFRMLRMLARPLKLEYMQEGISRPALSLLDTNFKLIPQTFFRIEQRSDENGLHDVEVTSRNDCGLENLNAKAIGIIQKVYNGRV